MDGLVLLDSVAALPAACSLTAAPRLSIAAASSALEDAYAALGMWLWLQLSVALRPGHRELQRPVAMGVGDGHGKAIIETKAAFAEQFFFIRTKKLFSGTRNVFFWDNN